MTRTTRVAILAIALVTIHLNPSARLQAGSPRVAAQAQNAAPQATFRGGTDLVQVDVSVLDGKRHTVRGLTAADFTILEDGEPRDIKSFEAVGFTKISINELSSLKSLGVTPGFIKGFKDIGFNNISLNEATSLKAMGVTPEYVKEMKAKGFNYRDLQKYITLKTIEE